MFNKFIILLLLIPFLFSCETNPATDAEGVISAKGGVRYGGDFRFMSSEKAKSLFPLELNDIYSNRAVSQIFHGLLIIDPRCTDLVSSISFDGKVNEDSSLFIFKLRYGVYFQDDACFEDGKRRKVTALDFRYVLEFACSSQDLNQIS